jgi:Cu/Ag efflux protein CusF
MHHKNIVRFTLAAVALLIGSTPVFAHAGMEHVMGTVAAVTDSSITVDTVQHKQITVLLDPSTKFTCSNAQASLKDLKVGDRVVIHAKPNADKKLVGVTVQWGANASAHSDHADTKQ